MTSFLRKYEHFLFTYRRQLAICCTPSGTFPLTYQTKSSARISSEVLSLNARSLQWMQLVGNTALTSSIAGRMDPVVPCPISSDLAPGMAISSVNIHLLASHIDCISDSVPADSNLTACAFPYAMPHGPHRPCLLCRGPPRQANAVYGVASLRSSFQNSCYSCSC